MLSWSSLFSLSCLNFGIFFKDVWRRENVSWCETFMLKIKRCSCSIIEDVLFSLISDLILISKFKLLLWFYWLNRILFTCKLRNFCWRILWICSLTCNNILSSFTSAWTSSSKVYDLLFLLFWNPFVILLHLVLRCLLQSTLK